MLITFSITFSKGTFFSFLDSFNNKKNRGPARSDERLGGVAREGQGYPYWQHDMMIYKIIEKFEKNLLISCNSISKYTYQYFEIEIACFKLKIIKGIPNKS